MHKTITYESPIQIVTISPTHYAIIVHKLISYIMS